MPVHMLAVITQVPTAIKVPSEDAKADGVKEQRGAERDARRGRRHPARRASPPAGRGSAQLCRGRCTQRMLPAKDISIVKGC